MTIKEDEHAHHPRCESCGKEFNNATEISDHIIECTEIVGDTHNSCCEKAIYFLIYKSEWSNYWIVILMSKSTSVSSITNIL